MTLAPGAHRRRAHLPPTGPPTPIHPRHPRPAPEIATDAGIAWWLIAVSGDGEVYVQAPARVGATVKAALTVFPTAQPNTLGEFIQLREATVATALNLFYVLLALCVVISPFGIVNTLAPSVTERTREIGMPRAIGMTRGEVARMIRIESAIIALIGAAIGILVGLILAALSAQALSAWNVRLGIPWIPLLMLLAVAVIAGTVAAILVARRAARLDPLAALSYE
jgi:putative ABC transport system permease protein